MSANSTKDQLLEKLQNKKYRRTFADRSIDTGIATQLYALRDSRKWNQTKLAKETGMAQARISVLEDQDYQKYSISTLKRIAAAFDVALIVRFVSFRELARWVTNLSSQDLAPPSFAEEQAGLHREEEDSAASTFQRLIPTPIHKQDIEDILRESRRSAPLDAQRGAS